eukprot:3483745-Amphidinium_carterae.1
MKDILGTNFESPPPLEPRDKAFHKLGIHSSSGIHCRQSLRLLALWQPLVHRILMLAEICFETKLILKVATHQIFLGLIENVVSVLKRSISQRLLSYSGGSLWVDRYSVACDFRLLPAGCSRLNSSMLGRVPMSIAIQRIGMSNLYIQSGYRPEKS